MTTIKFLTPEIERRLKRIKDNPYPGTEGVVVDYERFTQWLAKQGIRFLNQDPELADCFLDLRRLAVDFGTEGKDKLELLVSQPRTYKVGEEIGRGTWGRVFSARDQFGEEVAIKKLDPTPIAKEQMEHRNLNPWRVLNNEAMTLSQSACANVVPRRIETQDGGEPYIVMPRYRKFLSDVIHEGNAPLFLGYGLDERQIIRYSLQISRGLAEIHRVLKRHYGDLKPDNVAIDNDTDSALIADLGTSSIGRSLSPRDHMGFEGTRAPEDNQDNGNIDKRSDVYSFTSLLYRFLTGEYLDSNHHQGNPKAFDSHNKRKIKEKAPKGFQKFLIKGSRYNPSERYQDAVEMTSALEKVIDDLGIAKQTRKAKPWIFTILGLAGMASLIYAHVSTYEPKKLEMPVMYERNGSPGLLFLNQRDKTELTFDSETNPDLPRIAPVKGMMTAGIDRLSKLSTDNRNVAYLVKAMAYAFWTGRSVQDSPTTDSQEDLYRRYVTPEDAKRNEAICGPVYPVVAKSIEYALTKSQRQDGKIDLEDTIAIARLGAETVKLAKGLSNSQDFRQYANAKLKDGSYLIPKREREFIGLAIYYAKHDVDLMDKQEDLPY